VLVSGVVGDSLIRVLVAVMMPLKSSGVNTWELIGGAVQGNG
jgi:hypothetical protein